MSQVQQQSGDLQGSDDEMLARLLRETFQYFLDQADPDTGLIADKTSVNCPASIAVVGMALTCYIVGTEEGLVPRREACRRILRVLRFLHSAEQSANPSATGYKGFYYHFLDMRSGKRVWRCELSTVDTAFLVAGILSTTVYFSGDDPDEKELRLLGDQIYKRIDWQWALNGGHSITHGWRPRSGFLPYRWNDNYSEAILLYVLALASPTHSIALEGYEKWTATFTVKDIYATPCIYAGPLFIHQFSHLWIDFRGIFDSFTRKLGFDYFENSRRATYVHRQYAVENPLQYRHYSRYCWGLTASDGPGCSVLKLDGVERRFFGYKARGAPFGPDDGTTSPWAVVASLPFAPEIVLETIRYSIEQYKLKKNHGHGFDASFNPTYPERKENPHGWISPYKFGLNQGPVVMMIANFKNGLIWNLMKACPYIRMGLHKAGFTGGWLEENSATSHSLISQDDEQLPDTKNN